MISLQKSFPTINEPPTLIEKFQIDWFRVVLNIADRINQYTLNYLKNNLGAITPQAAAFLELLSNLPLVTRVNTILFLITHTDTSIVKEAAETNMALMLPNANPDPTATLPDPPYGVYNKMINFDKYRIFSVKVPDMHEPAILIENQLDYTTEPIVYTAQNPLIYQAAPPRMPTDDMEHLILESTINSSPEKILITFGTENALNTTPTLYYNRESFDPAKIAEFEEQAVMFLYQVLYNPYEVALEYIKTVNLPDSQLSLKTPSNFVWALVPHVKIFSELVLEHFSAITAKNETIEKCLKLFQAYINRNVDPKHYSISGIISRDQTRPYMGEGTSRSVTQQYQPLYTQRNLKPPPQSQFRGATGPMNWSSLAQTSNNQNQLNGCMDKVWTMD